MKSTIGKGILAASLVIASSAYATPDENGLTALYTYGEAVAPAEATRVVTIGPGTKWVNVRDGDAVKFVDARSGDSFAWEFDDTAGETIAFSKIAPAGFAGGTNINVYVSDLPVTD